MTYSAPPPEEPIIFIAFYFIEAKMGNTPANVVASACLTFTSLNRFGAVANGHLIGGKEKDITLMYNKRFRYSKKKTLNLFKCSGGMSWWCHVAALVPCGEKSHQMFWLFFFFSFFKDLTDESTHQGSLVSFPQGPNYVKHTKSRARTCVDLSFHWTSKSCFKCRCSCCSYCHMNFLLTSWLLSEEQPYPLFLLFSCHSFVPFNWAV